MCLILFAYRVHPVYKLIVAANRDEFYKCATAPAHYWEDQSEILAGRDLEKMGTWMGVTTSGGFAALTNYRDPSEKTDKKLSRGELVAGALNFNGEVADYMESLAGANDMYPGYNLIAGNTDELYYYSNVGRELKKLKPGIYGVSNHLLNTEWPKVQKGKVGLTEIINRGQGIMVEELMDLLKNTDGAEDQYLPNTGVRLELERMLSPMFIKSKDYGTRSSTVLLMSDNEVEYVERVFVGDEVSDRRYKFKV